MWIPTATTNVRQIDFNNGTLFKGDVEYLDPQALLMKTAFLFIFLLTLPLLGFAQSLSPAEARERIDRATPEALPQSPRVSKARTDAQRERLKGKVRIVTDSVVEPDGTNRMRSESYYDESGYLTKRVLYDYRGNPWSIRVYGYIDGKRVSKSASITYEYDPPPAMAPPGSGPRPTQAPADKRYEFSYEVKFDDSKRPVEDILYSNNGTLLSREIYSYNGDTVESVSYDKSGKETERTVRKDDAKDNLIEKSSPRTDGSYGTSIYRYKYETFDSHGNWLRATVVGKVDQYGGGQKDFQQTEIRTITYY